MFGFIGRGAMSINPLRRSPGYQIFWVKYQNKVVAVS